MVPLVKILFSDVLVISVSLRFQIRTFITLVFLSIMVQLHAQKKDYHKGYIVTFDGDTLEGMLMDRSSGSFSELYKRVRFKPIKGFKKKYGADKILGYGYSGHVFESVPLAEKFELYRFRYYINKNNDRIFLKVLRKESLNYYQMEYMEEDNNYINFIPLFHIPGSNEMVRVTQGILGLKRKRLVEYFRECPELVKAIEEKTLKETLEVFDFYLNRCFGE